MASGKQVLKIVDHRFLTGYISTDVIGNGYYPHARSTDGWEIIRKFDYVIGVRKKGKVISADLRERIAAEAGCEISNPAPKVKIPFAGGLEFFGSPYERLSVYMILYSFNSVTGSFGRSLSDDCADILDIFTKRLGPRKYAKVKVSKVSGYLRRVGYNVRCL